MERLASSRFTTRRPRSFRIESKPRNHLHRRQRRGSFDTSDGSDNRDFTIYGGGAVSTDGSRGAYIRVSGNEASGVGSISMRSGTASGASIVLDCYSSNGVVALKNQNSHIVWVDATGMHLKLTTNVIDTGTSDGSDNANVTITGGGAASSTRGAVIQLHGNESSGNAGVLQIDTGNVASTPLFLRALGSGGYITMSAGGSTEVARLNSTGMQLSQPTTKSSPARRTAAIMPASRSTRAARTTRAERAVRFASLWK